VIVEINDHIIQFTTQLLDYKMLCKCRKDECPLGVVVVAECCVNEVNMAWEKYLLNEFI
jgi:hypothetical protein